MAQSARRAERMTIEPIRPRVIATMALATVLALLASACTTVRVTPTERSSVEQRLLVRALERAAARLDVTPRVGRTLRLELFSLSKDQPFAREYLRARLEERGLRVSSGADADVEVQVFTTALAVDTADTLIGLPAMQAPVLAVPIPEIALFKWERSRGHAELQTYVYDGRGRLLGQLRDVLGQAKWDRFVVLILVSFTVTDVDEPPGPAR